VSELTTITLREALLREALPGRAVHYCGAAIKVICLKSEAVFKGTTA